MNISIIIAIIIVITVIIILVIYVGSEPNLTDISSTTSTKTELSNSSTNIISPINSETQPINGTVNNTVPQNSTTPSILDTQQLTQVTDPVIIPEELSNSNFFSFPDLTSLKYSSVWCYKGFAETKIYLRITKQPYKGYGHGLHFSFLDAEVLSLGSSITFYLNSNGTAVYTTPIPNQPVVKFTLSILPNNFSESSVKPEFLGKTKALNIGLTDTKKLIINESTPIVGGYRVLVANLSSIYYEKISSFIAEKTPVMLQTSNIENVSPVVNMGYVPTIRSVFPRGKFIVMHMVAASSRKGHVYFTTKLNEKKSLRSFYCPIETVDMFFKTCDIATGFKNNLSYDVIREKTSVYSPSQKAVFGIFIPYFVELKIT